MLHFSQYVIVRQMAGILDMAALGASEAPADLAFNLKGALRPAVRDDDVEYEGMCRCLVEMLLNKEGMFCELYDKDDKFLGLNRIMVHKILKLIDPKLMDSNDDVGAGALLVDRCRSAASAPCPAPKTRAHQWASQPKGSRPRGAPRSIHAQGRRPPAD